MKNSVLRRKIARGIIWLIIPSFVGACAKSEHMDQYYLTEQMRTDAIIESINLQAADRGTRQVAMMATYSTSMTAAATTETPSDDVAVALAWGFYMGKPDGIEIPRLTPLKAPPTNVDYIRAWSPIIGMVMPFIYPLAYGWASSSSGTSIAADNGGTILLDSANTGSYNYAGNNYDQLITNDNNSNMGALNESGIRPEVEGEGDGDGVGGDATCDPNNPPGGYTPLGTPLMCEGCSCTSFAASECVCPVPF